MKKIFLIILILLMAVGSAWSGEWVNGAETTTSGSGSGAPTDAKYLTTEANGDLSAEVVVSENAATLLGHDFAAMLADLGVEQEDIEDLIGAMLTGNTETGITVTYQDDDGTIDFVIGDLSGTYEVQLTNEAGLYAALSDVSDFVQTSEIDTAAELESVANLGAYASDMLAATNEANFKSRVNLEPGVDVQAYSATTVTAESGDALVISTNTISAHANVESVADGAMDPDLIAGDTDDDDLLDGDKVEPASQTEKGTVEQATDAECEAGTDTDRYVTPAGLAAYTAANDQTLYFTECIYIEDPTADDDLKSIWYTKGQAVTITSIRGESDGDVDFDLNVDDGSATGVNGSYIEVDAGVTEDTSLGGDTTMADGHRLDLDINAVDDDPTWVSICWTYTID